MAGASRLHPPLALIWQVLLACTLILHQLADGDDQGPFSSSSPAILGPPSGYPPAGQRSFTASVCSLTAVLLLGLLPSPNRRRAAQAAIAAAAAAPVSFPGGCCHGKPMLENGCCVSQQA